VSCEGLFSWDIAEDAAAVVVRAAGEIDLASEEDFATALGRALAGHAPVILVDLSEVTFLGSAALHVLLEANRETEKQHRAFRVAHGGSFAARVLDVAGLDQVLAVFHTIEQALGSDGAGSVGSHRKLGLSDAFQAAQAVPSRRTAATSSVLGTPFNR
jgi:anti-sigma B factor antagonist